MPRYIENLNTCSNPTSGDYLWIVDASAASDDKDRKVDAGLFAQVGGTTFTGTVNFNSNAEFKGTTRLPTFDGGSGVGNTLLIERNNNATTPAPGAVAMRTANNNFNSIWPDDSGLLRIRSITGVSNANKDTGTVVGTQTSSLDSKDVLDGVTGIDDVLAAVRAGAEAVRRFTYKSGAFGGEEFEGVVVDFAPRYGMDRDAEHPAGKSLNEIVIIGDLLRAVDHLVQRVAALEAAR
jgi:hypothetical protein